MCPLQAKGQFKKQSVANGVEIVVPVPSDADSPKFKTTVGSARYLPERNVVIWSIKSFPVSDPARGSPLSPQPGVSPLPCPLLQALPRSLSPHPGLSPPPWAVPPCPPPPGGGCGGPHVPVRGRRGGRST